MAKSYSTGMQQTLNRTSADEPVLLLLEIDHTDLATPVRVVNDTQDITSNGNLFTACAFRYTLPDDLEQGNTRARIAIDNVGRELVQWLELSNGGEGATVRMMQVRPSAPDTIEWETTMTLSNVSQNVMEVSGQLGYEDLLKRPAVSLVYDPATAPGVF